MQVGNTWRWGGAFVGLVGALSSGCGDDDDRSSGPRDDVERGTIASTRWDACGVEVWKPLTVRESLVIEVTAWPEVFSEGVDCVVAADSCEEVVGCNDLFHSDDQLELRPECGSEPTDHCEGNVAKYCRTDDDVTWYEFSYDCTMAGATCIEGVDANGVGWSDCQAPLDPCDGHETSYCDGTRAVVCDETYLGGNQSPWIFDCAEAFDSTCVVVGDGANRVECEGPAVGERQCDDGVDNDEDGEVDCDDSECSCD